jgi:hypothetical protein
MHSFKDNAEREWNLSLSLGAEARVFEETDVYLSDISSTDNPVIDRVVNDPGFLGQVIWTLCKKQVEGQGLTQEDFLDAIDSSVAEKAREALIEEILDFLGHRGQAIRAARAERMRLVKEIETENVEAMRGLSGNDLLQMLQRLLSQANSTSTDGSVEEFAESILAA